MLFLGMANAYVMRTNMSVAIVAMVNHTAITDGHDDVFDDECPNSNLTEVVSSLKVTYIKRHTIVSVFYPIGRKSRW